MVDACYNIVKSKNEPKNEQIRLLLLNLHRREQEKKEKKSHHKRRERKKYFDFKYEGSYLPLGSFATITFMIINELISLI